MDKLPAPICGVANFSTTSSGTTGHAEEEHEHICIITGDRDGTVDRDQSQTCTEAQADGKTESSLETQMEATELSTLSYGHCGSSRPYFGVPGAASSKTRGVRSLGG